MAGVKDYAVSAVLPRACSQIGRFGCIGDRSIAEYPEAGKLVGVGSAALRKAHIAVTRDIHIGSSGFVGDGHCGHIDGSSCRKHFVIGGISVARHFGKQRGTGRA